MVVLITGGSHTGKTLLAQRLLEKYQYPYLSIDHLKMGLIRSGNTALTPIDDEQLTDYLWPIVREIVKTAVENHQNLVMEGCYIPFDWKNDFSDAYLKHIRYRCLILSKAYIETHFEEIRNYASVIERRLDDSYLTKEKLIRDNERNLRQCREYGCDYIFIHEEYRIDLNEIVSEYLIRPAAFADMEIASQIMVTSFRNAFAAFVSRETMNACTDPENCRAMLEQVFRSGKMHFLMGGRDGFLCWKDGEAEIVAIHSLPKAWGSGLGGALLTKAISEIGNKPIFLWVFKDNTRARRFYEKHGFVWDGNERVSEFDSAIEVRYVKKEGDG